MTEQEILQHAADKHHRTGRDYALCIIDVCRGVFARPQAQAEESSEELPEDLAVGGNEGADPAEEFDVGPPEGP
jgi:hypothetical protein